MAAMAVRDQQLVELGVDLRERAEARYSKLGALSPPKGNKFRISDPAPGCKPFPFTCYRNTHGLRPVGFHFTQSHNFPSSLHRNQEYYYLHGECYATLLTKGTNYG